MGSLDVLLVGASTSEEIFSGSKETSLDSRSGVDTTLFESFSRRNDGLFSGGHLE